MRLAPPPRPCERMNKGSLAASPLGGEPCERANKRVDDAPPHALRTLRTNEQSPKPDAEVSSFVRTDLAPTAKAPTRRFVRSFAESLPRPPNPTPQHYPRQRHDRSIARRPSLTGMWQEKHKSLLGCWLTLLAPASGSPWDADVQDSLIPSSTTPADGL